MKSYTTAAKAKDSEQSGLGRDIPFEIDGREFVAHKPKDAQISLVISRTSRRASHIEVVAAALDFFDQILGRDDAEFLKDRLLDSEDTFDAPDVLNILFDLIEEWTGKAPEKQPDSSD